MAQSLGYDSALEGPSIPAYFYLPALAQVPGRPLREPILDWPAGSGLALVCLALAVAAPLLAPRVPHPWASRWA